ncbi:MAG: hypothetical protein APF76_00540 [Desulfitibacter sp. BRH_c19]|nr:MAG: hypothetical protein APF76_00540 [Desulfitibacter sp. BRH_c19]
MIVYNDVSVTFNNHYLFRNINLKVNKGDKVLVYGKSGIGKSVLFKMLLGFILPKEGEVYFDNKLLNSKNVWNVRKKIAYVSQGVDIGSVAVIDLINTIFSYKANSHLLLASSPLIQLLYDFELTEETLTKNLSDLSGGERQRIAIILAILLGRDVFLLDEVTAALDSNLKNKVINLFIGNPNWTVLIISHDKDWLENKQIKVFNLEEYQ